MKNGFARGSGGELASVSYGLFGTMMVPLGLLRRAVKPIKRERTQGPNEYCDCWSGKKFKHCHGRFN